MMTWLIGVGVTGVLIMISWIFGGRDARRLSDEIERQANAREAAIKTAVEKTAKAHAEKQRTIDVENRRDFE